MRKRGFIVKNLGVVLSTVLLVGVSAEGVSAETPLDAEKADDAVYDVTEFDKGEVTLHNDVQADVVDVLLDKDKVTIDGEEVPEYDYVWHADPTTDHKVVKNSPAEYFTGTEPDTSGNYIAHDIRYYPKLDLKDYKTVQYDEEDEWAYYYKAEGYTEYIFATLPYYEDAVEDFNDETDESNAYESFMHSEKEAYENPVFHITKAGTYRLHGEWNGQIKVDVGEDEADRVTLVLDDLEVECDVAPAIDFDTLYECETDGKSGKTPDTSKAGANIIIADGTENEIEGSNVFRMLKPKYKDDDEQSKYEGSVKLQKKLRKEDGALYSHVSINVDGEDKKDGIMKVKAKCEGFCSEMHMTINGGIISIESQDDGVNTNEDNVSVFTMNDGVMRVLAGRGRSGDGIDSNGYIVVNGGDLVTVANYNSDCGLDSDLGSFVNGGRVFSTGSSKYSVDEGSKQCAMHLHFKDKNGVNGPINVVDEGGKLIFSYDEYKDVFISNDEENDAAKWVSAIISVPGIKKGDKYSVYSLGKADGEHKYGMYDVNKVSKIENTYRQKGISDSASDKSASTVFAIDNNVQAFRDVENEEEKAATLTFGDAEEKENIIEEKVGTCTIAYTAKVSYNGCKHVVKGSKNSKKYSDDIELKIYHDGKEVSSQDYNISYHDNKNVSDGRKKPNFVISIKKKSGVDSATIKELKKKKFEFTIIPADLSLLNLSKVKISDKKKGIKVDKLEAEINSAKIKLKQVKSSGKGDFKVVGYTDSSKKAVTIEGINNFSGTAVVNSFTVSN